MQAWMRDAGVGLASPPLPPKLLGKLWDPQLRKVGVAPGCGSSRWPPPPWWGGKGGSGPPIGVGTTGCGPALFLHHLPEAFGSVLTPPLPPKKIIIKVTSLVSSSPPSSSPSHGAVPVLRGSGCFSPRPPPALPHADTPLQSEFFRGFEALCCV